MDGSNGESSQSGQLRCTVCFENYELSVMRSCENRHHTCLDCFARLDPIICPMCRQSFAMEQQQRPNLLIAGLNGEVDDQARQFQCTACFDHFALSAIISCGNRHQTCLTCVMRLDPMICQVCRQHLTLERYRRASLEVLANDAYIPCSNAFYGCQLRILGSEQGAHQLECGYRPYQCFSLGCAFSGLDIVNHLETHHAAINNHHEEIIFEVADVDHGAADQLMVWSALQTVHGRTFLNVMERRAVRERKICSF